MSDASRDMQTRDEILKRVQKPHGKGMSRRTFLEICGVVTFSAASAIAGEKYRPIETIEQDVKDFLSGGIEEPYSGNWAGIKVPCDPSDAFIGRKIHFLSEELASLPEEAYGDGFKRVYTQPSFWKMTIAERYRNKGLAEGCLLEVPEAINYQGK